MLTALTCAVLSIYCIHDPAPAHTPAPQVTTQTDSASGSTVFERLNAARAARMGVKVTERTNRFPHAPDVTRKPLTLRDALEDQEAAKFECRRRVRLKKPAKQTID